MKTYAGIDEQLSSLDKAQIVLQNIPFDGTSTWGKGADKGFEAFLDASENMELYDIETNSEVYRKGIFLAEPLTDCSDAEEMYRKSYACAQKWLKTGKFCTFFGGEHSISIGPIKAFYEHYKDLSVLHIDAHADLRPTYMGTAYNHACALHDASKNTNLVQVGIRSMDVSELQYMDRSQTYFAHEIMEVDSWMEKSIQQMTQDVYITLDLDALDPSVMPSTGTPEPGGLGWYQLLTYLKLVFEKRNVVGFDIVELAPISGIKAPEFLVAKLYYKMLTYKFHK